MLILIVLQCAHAFSYGAMHAVAIKFIHDKFHLYHQGRAQAIYSAFGFGLGGALGAFGSGWLVDQFDYSFIFICSAAVSALALILSFFVEHKSKCASN